LYIIDVYKLNFEMSKHRKNHKQKVAAFKQRQVQKKNQIEKLQNLFQEQVAAYHQANKRALVIESLLTTKPEMFLETTDGFTVNTDTVDEVEGILIWKADNTPVMSSYVAQEEVSVYTMNYVNQMLTKLQENAQMRLMEEASKAYDEAVARGEIVPEVEAIEVSKEE
jgi:citrate lyase synthetase